MLQYAETPLPTPWTEKDLKVGDHLVVAWLYTKTIPKSPQASQKVMTAAPVDHERPRAGRPSLRILRYKFPGWRNIKDFELIRKFNATTVRRVIASIFE
ncbi:hypothetical protein PoB_005026600 [Plakobranchus ocellatus]|uniref:Uncharacterized protein n=1 Tax=Plakobranchus ocellatus TaxID=259542 RepID=A0AAV4BXC3_9GAST|nr:hypothetical protein PoB_005026600 [Plakobranchus ocellatus]